MGFSSEDLTNKHGDINRTYSLDLSGVISQFAMENGNVS